MDRKEFRQLAVEHTHSIRGNFVQLRRGLGCAIESLRLICEDTYVMSRVLGSIWEEPLWNSRAFQSEDGRDVARKDSGDSGQATTTRAQPRGWLEAESDTRRSWRIVDSRLWRFRGRRPWSDWKLRRRDWGNDRGFCWSKSLDRCSNGGKVADRAWTLDVRAHLFAGLQRSMTVVTGRRSERRELASGWSHWVVQTTKALDTWF